MIFSHCPYLIELLQVNKVTLNFGAVSIEMIQFCDQIALIVISQLIKGNPIILQKLLK